MSGFTTCSWICRSRARRPNATSARTRISTARSVRGWAISRPGRRRKTTYYGAAIAPKGAPTMPTTQSNETYTQNFIRAFTQRGGPSPSNAVRYAGLDEQYLMVGDISRPDRGGVNAINVNDPFVRGLFARTGI